MGVANNHAGGAKELKIDPELNAELDSELDTEFDSEPDTEFDSDFEPDFESEIGAELDAELKEADADIAFTDNVGEISVEIDVEELIAELEAESGNDHDQQEQSTRKKLEDILEAKRAEHELDEIDDFELADLD